MPGQLFTEYFLTDGIKATAEWRESVSAVGEFGSFRDGVRERYGVLMRLDSPNEAVTEQEIVRPVLELLGWSDYLPQQGASRNEDIPDHLLFSDADSKERAGAREAARVSVTGMPGSWRRASGSACRSMRGTRMRGTGRGRRTARY